MEGSSKPEPHLVMASTGRGVVAAPLHSEGMFWSVPVPTLPGRPVPPHARSGTVKKGPLAFGHVTC